MKYRKKAEELLEIINFDYEDSDVGIIADALREAAAAEKKALEPFAKLWVELSLSSGTDDSQCEVYVRQGDLRVAYETFKGARIERASAGDRQERGREDGQGRSGVKTDWLKIEPKDDFDKKAIEIYFGDHFEEVRQSFWDGVVHPEAGLLVRSIASALRGDAQK
jgi:hypothetical protein